jgi:hypothetical protein
MIEELLKKLPEAKTKQERQDLSALIIASLPDFFEELGIIEQEYFRGLKRCVDSEGSKSAGEVLIQETDLYRKYKKTKRLYDAIQMALPVLNMYTREY